MSRLVRAAANETGIVTFSASPVSVVAGSPGAPPVPVDSVAAGGSVTQVDNYAARMVKYVPSEVIAFYLAADKLFDPLSTTPQTTEQAASSGMVTNFVNGNGPLFALAIFFLGLVATPLYIRLQAEKEQVWGVHAVMSTVAYIIWTYATQGGVFSSYGLYDPRFASLLVLVYTLLSGFVVPSKGKS